MVVVIYNSSNDLFIVKRCMIYIKAYVLHTLHLNFLPLVSILCYQVFTSLLKNRIKIYRSFSHHVSIPVNGGWKNNVVVRPLYHVIPAEV